MFHDAVDVTLHGDEAPNPEVRTVVHLHGAKVEPDSDGYPEAWFTNNFGQVGPFFDNKIYYYPNDQQATELWYHDHGLGTTRLNIYRGAGGRSTSSATIIEDDLNLPKGAYEIPLMIQDRAFNEDGSLNYPVQTTVAPTRKFRPSGSPSSSATRCWSTARCGRTSRSSPGSIGSGCSTARTLGGIT